MTPDRWLVLTVRVPSEELLDELAEGLVALGGAAVEEDVDLLTTYVPAPAEPEPFVAAAADRLAGLAGRDLEILWRWQDDEDWSRKWREGLEPRRVGRRLVVTQPWNPVEPAGDDIVITIDPATAFGTGEHATTRGALRLLESMLRPGDDVLDVGTGSGILAIAAVRLGAGRVLAVESDPGSMDSCRENLERNDAADGVTLVHREADPAYLASLGGAGFERGFDLLLANMLSGIIVPLLPAFAGAVSAGGRVILGGILVGESAEVRRAAESAGLALAAEETEGEWWTALFGAA